MSGAEVHNWNLFSKSVKMKTKWHNLETQLPEMFDFKQTLYL